MPEPVTVKNIRILKNFGVFADRTESSPRLEFRKNNLIYGFNGSGKSTLARLFAAIETKNNNRIPSDCEYEVSLSDGGSIKNCLDANYMADRILVFNTDYIDRNLQWTQGSASPVFFIGENQAEAGKELERVNQKILEMQGAESQAERDGRAAEKNFSDYKRNQAKLIATELFLVGRQYEAPAYIRDVEHFRESQPSPLGSDRVIQAKEILRFDEHLPVIERISGSLNGFFDILAAAYTLCNTKESDVQLEEVKKYPYVLSWLQHGLALHTENDLKRCLFCANEFTQERKNQISLALDERVRQFQAEVQSHDSLVNHVKDSLLLIQRSIPSKESFYKRFQEVIASDTGDIKQLVDWLIAQVSMLRSKLTERQHNPAVDITLSGIASPEEMLRVLNQIDDLKSRMDFVIEKNNEETQNFGTRFARARDDIKQSCIQESIEEYNRLESEYVSAQAVLNKIREAIVALKMKRMEISAKIKEHGPAAEKINALVKAYLGHGELSVVPVEQGYEFYRHGVGISGPPSEGEKTAIAIAYFLTSIEAEGRKLEELVLVIDDPVSSLDTKALNYACALIKTKTSNVAQIIILTHNVNCMNEFRKYWKGGLKGEKPTASLLYIDAKMPSGSDRRVSEITSLPKLLLDYDSEYHYLFSRVLQLAESNGDYFEYGYMMPNVIRRVFEVFLAFKCPGSSGFSEKLKHLCDDYRELDRAKILSLDRLVQVESHSDSLDDLLSFSSMTVEECREAAVALLHVFETVDRKHLDRLRRLCR